MLGDQERFAAACAAIIGVERETSGIGTLGERTLHAVLKRYMEPWEANHEVKIGSYVADIVGEDGIVEVQTRNFGKMRKKLEEFLSVAPVTVVYPITATKRMCWVDPETGETSALRKSPKRGTAYHCFYELYFIRTLLSHPNFRLRLLLIDTEEYRSLNGWSHDRKRGSHRQERIPTALVEEIAIQSPGDWLLLIPPGLPERFTTKDFAAGSGLRQRDATTAVNVLRNIGVVENIGKQGRLQEYRIAPELENY